VTTSSKVSLFWLALVVIVLTINLQGCGIDQIRTTVATKGAEVNDQLLHDAEFWICKGASVGSVRRKYGRSSEDATAWQALCDGGKADAKIVE